ARFGPCSASLDLVGSEPVQRLEIGLQRCFVASEVREPGGVRRQIGELSPDLRDPLELAAQRLADRLTREVALRNSQVRRIGRYGLAALGKVTCCDERRQVGRGDLIE